MKNLKKVLCLVLAFTMLLSVMVVSTGAANFTDNDEIVNTEAVDTMTALNIINGLPDGSFNPSGIVTRAEMAKMICVALNGGKDPQLGTTAVSYTDTATSWAAGYIEYCTNLGIVAGRGDGTFGPTATVTGTEAAKMLLVAIGYDADAEGFTGASWAMSVNVAANQKDLFEDLETLNPSAGLSRDDAAQMIYNAINALMVEYEYKLTTVNGTLTTVAVVKDTDETIIGKKFDMVKEYGIITDVSYDSDEDEYVVNTTNGTYYTDFDCSDLFRMNVKFLCKGGAKDDVYGAFAYKTNVMVTALVGDADYEGTTCTVDDVDYDLAYTYYDLPVYNFLDSARLYSMPSDAFMFALIDNNDDDEAEVAVIYPYTVQTVSYVGKSTLVLSSNTFDKDDVTYYTGIAKDDFVKVIAAVNTVDDTAVITELTPMTGTVTATKNSGTTFKLGGVYYDFATAGYLELPSKVVAGTEYEDVIVVNGYAFNVAEVDDEANVGDYAIVLAYASNANTINGPQAKLLFTDGTTSVVDVDDTMSSTYYEPLVDDLVLFDVDDDVYTLYQYDEVMGSLGDGFDTPLATGDDSFKNPSSGSSTIGGSYIASGAVVFIDNGEWVDGVVDGVWDSDWDVITGAELAEMDDLYMGDPNVDILYAYADENSSTGFLYAQLVVATVTDTTAVSDDQYGYVTETPEVVEVDDDQVYSVTFWDGTDYVTTTTTNEEGTVANLDKGAIITFTYDGAQIDISHATAIIPSVVAAVTAYNGDDEIQFTYGYTTEDINNDEEDEYVISGEGTVSHVFNVDDDTVIIYIDVDAEEGVEGGAIQMATDTYYDNYIANVMFQADTNFDVTILIVDVQNDILDVQ